jgi:hypothetical protein
MDFIKLAPPPPKLRHRNSINNIASSKPIELLLSLDSPVKIYPFLFNWILIQDRVIDVIVWFRFFEIRSVLQILVNTTQKESFIWRGAAGFLNFLERDGLLEDTEILPPF